MIKRKKRLLLWLPAVIMMCLIFMFSLQNGDKSSDTSGKVCYAVASVTVDDFSAMQKSQQQIIVEMMQHAVRKTAHFTEYALLGVSFLLPLGGKFKNSLTAPAIAVLLSAAYACTDEIHQLFVAERSGQFTDVMIDTSGALTGVVLVCSTVCLIKHIKKKTIKNAQTGKGDL